MALNNPIYEIIDLEQLGILPNNWNIHIEEVVLQFGRFVRLDGKSSTSREPENTEGCDCYILSGDVIQKELTWLFNLYTTRLVEFATIVAGQPMKYSDDVESGIVINSLRGINARYEWHVDSNPMTGILYATTHEESEGGELVFKINNEFIKVTPTAGEFILFDARLIPHCVFPLTNDRHRISVPMNFYFLEQELVNKRPDELSDYLFGRK